MAAARLTPAVLALLAVLAAPASAAPRPHAPSVEGDRVVAPGDALTVVAGVRSGRVATVRVLLAAGGERVVLGTRRVRGPRRRFLVTVPSVAPGDYRLLACTSRCRAALLPVRVVARAVPFVAPPPLPPAPAPLVLEAAPPAPPAPEPTAAGPPCASGVPGSEQLAATAGPASPAGDFTALFAASRRGWTGGDGALSVALDDGRVVWLFGDTFLGGLLADGTRDPNAPLVRNALVVQDGGCLTTLPTPADAPRGEWRWPAHAVLSADGKDLHTLWARVRRTGAGAFDFEVRGTVVVTHSLPSLEQDGDVVALPSKGRLLLGAAIVRRPEALYLYGVDEATPHRLHLARAATGDPAGPLEFWDGAAWSSDVAASVPLLDADVATQLSVVDRGADLVLVSQSPFDPAVRAWTAPGPTGPWTAAGTLATLPAVDGAWTYNAVLHPWSATTGGLLLGYSLHPVDAADLHARPELYRPRFTRVALP